MTLTKEGVIIPLIFGSLGGLTGDWGRAKVTVPKKQYKIKNLIMTDDC
jgi:hypothetical protein